MMIRVMYHDGLTEMVRPPVLQHLIETGKIYRFRRIDGWAEIGSDPVRGGERTSFDGQERRRHPFMH